MKESTQAPQDAPAEESPAHANPDNSGEPELPDVHFARTLLQFFLIPALVVGVCVGIFFFFGWLVSEEKSSLDYLRDIKTGSSTRRWQAAFELAQFVKYEPERAREEGLVRGMVELFQEAEGDDPRVRRYLALALGNLAAKEAVPVLLDALDDTDPETRIFAIWALGALGDARAVQPLMRMVGHSDPGVRKIAVYSLGTLRATEAAETLRAALNDPQLDVTWNAAIALAQIGDDQGRSRILQMLDRTALSSIPDMNEEQKAEAMVTAVQGATLLGGRELEERLRLVAEGDPNLRVREAALEALQQLAQDDLPES